MSFGGDINKFGQNTIARHEQIRKGVCLKLFGAIIKDTPVLTGALRASWICSIGKPDLVTNHGTAQGLATTLVMTKVAESKPEDTVMIVTRLPYARRIEYDGWSHTKAPQGMVRRNVARFRQLVDREVGRL